MSPILEGIRTQAEHIACTCLSEPWNKIEQTIATDMAQWQNKLVEAEQAIADVPNATIQELAGQLNQALTMILEAVRSKNSVALSNALANEFIGTLKALDALIPGA